MKALLVLLLVAVAAVAVVPAGAQPPVTVQISGPTGVAPRAAAHYVVLVGGGPAAEGGNYSLEYWIEGSAVSGGTPLQSSPGRSGPNATNRFEIDITAPPSETVFELVVTATSTGAGNETASTVERYVIETKKPINLVARFRNSGSVAAVNVEVTFSVDGRVVGKETIARIEPAQTGTANHTWIPLGIADGRHTVRATADLDRDGVIEESAGELFVEDAFVRSAPGLSSGLAVLLVGLILGIGLLGVLALRRRLRETR